MEHGGALGMEALEGGGVLGVGLLSVSVEGLGELMEKVILLWVWWDGWWWSSGWGGDREGEIVVH